MGWQINEAGTAVFVRFLRTKTAEEGLGQESRAGGPRFLGRYGEAAFWATPCGFMSILPRKWQPFSRVTRLKFSSAGGYR